MDPRYLKFARNRAKLRRGDTEWFRFENLVSSAEPTVAIYLMDEIGYWGTTAEDFIRQLQGVEASNIDLHISSPGGEVFDGIAIYQALRNHKAQIHVYVDSLAASIASVIAMSGDKITIGRNATFMIHDGFGMCVGDARDMRGMADRLDAISDNIASVYAERAGKDTAHWRALMLEETWFTAEQAVAAGLADEMTPAHQRADDADDPENAWDLSFFNKRPPHSRDKIEELVNAFADRSTPTVGEPIAGVEEPVVSDTPQNVNDAGAISAVVDVVQSDIAPSTESVKADEPSSMAETGDPEEAVEPPSFDLDAFRAALRGAFE